MVLLTPRRVALGASAPPAQRAVEAVAKATTRATSRGEVYFIQAGGGPVKIGVSFDPYRRLSDLQGANAEPLVLLLTIAGGDAYELEGELLAAFVDSRLSGEWFTPTQALADICGCVLPKPDALATLVTAYIADGASA